MNRIKLSGARGAYHEVRKDSLGARRFGCGERRDGRTVSRTTARAGGGRRSSAGGTRGFGRRAGRRGRCSGAGSQLVQLHLVEVAAGERSVAGTRSVALGVGELGTETGRRVERVAAVAACRMERRGKTKRATKIVEPGQESVSALFLRGLTNQRHNSRLLYSTPE